MCIIYDSIWYVDYIYRNQIVSMFLLNVCCMLYKKGFITLQVFKCIGCQKKTIRSTRLWCGIMIYLIE